MKKTAILLTAVLLVSVFVFAACGSGSETPKETTKATEIVTTVAAKNVTEDDAKQAAFDKAGITEAAAGDLKVTDAEVNGEEVYLVTFEWSGYEYESYVSKTTGELVKYIFDGTEINLNK